MGETEQDLLRTLFDHIPMMVNFTGRDGRIKLVNREWERTLGWTLEEIQREDIDVLRELYPDPATCDDVRRFIAGASPDWGDFKTRVRDGRGITEAQRSGPRSLGLLGMRERTRLLGGEVTITGTPGRGTTVSACLPVRPAGEV